MAAGWPFLLPFTAGAAFSFLVFFLFSTYHEQHRTAAPIASTSTPVYTAPHQNIWSELTRNEVNELYEFLYKQSNFNLTKNPHGYGKENYVTDVEVLCPNKSDAVAFRDHGARQPQRYARVSVVETNVDEAYLCEYSVALPPSSATEILPLRYPHASDKHCIQTPVTDIWVFFIWALSIGYDIADITEDLLGGMVNLLDPFGPDALYIGARPALAEGGRMVYWLEFFRNGPRSDGRSLLPQGLYAKLNVSSPSPDSWSTTDWYYNGVLYPDLDALRKAWQSSNFTKTAVNLDGPWTDTEDFTANPPGRSQLPPLSIQPFGPRYQLSRKDSYISWMGFSFYLSTSASTGLSLYSIAFNSTPLIYHLGLQEALAHYAGSEPMQSGLEFLDTFFGMGSMMFPLVSGVDCPAYADYLPMMYHKNGETLINKNAICIFEYTSDAPLQRHTSEFMVTASRNTYLVVRSVSTVGNYDYTIDYLFYLDGSIEVKVRASGFIFTAFAGLEATGSSPSTEDELRPRSPSSNNPNSEYGYKIRPSASTSIHDHVILFRADIDLPNPSTNTFSTVSINPITKYYPWDTPEASSRNTMNIATCPLPHESGLNWASNSASMYLLQSNLTNTWGERRSYRIQPGTGMGTPSHLTILNSTSLSNSARWSSSDLWVLKAKDDEPAGAHPNNYLDPNHPLVDFSRIADGEALSDGGDDLVLYFNLGGHHVPHSGDLPNTLMHTSASSVMLTPFNFFDQDVSVYSRQGVRVDGRVNEAEDGWAKGVRWFGGRYSEEVERGEVRLDVGRDLEPGVEGYFEVDSQGRAVGNKVGGGLLGLFGAREGVKEEG